MKASEIKAMSPADLSNKLVQMKEELSKMKLTHRMSPLDNPMRITAVRKVVARLATELRQRDNQ